MMPPKSRLKQWLSSLIFIASVAFLSLLYGMYAGHLKKFPFHETKNIMSRIPQALHQIAPKAAHLLIQKPPNKKTARRSRSFHPTPYKKRITRNDSLPMSDGLTKIVRAEKDKLFVDVLTADGTVVHQWPIDWFTIWPNATHLTEKEIPKARPGTNIHGSAIMKNGDLIFNFEYLGLVRLTPCGTVVWRLPYRTHHTVFQAEDGTLWIPARILHHKEKPDTYPAYKPPFMEPMLLQVSPEGEILQEKSIFKLLQKNNLEGLFHLSSKGFFLQKSTGDTLHLNDVEIFPASWEAGFFSPGDLMISLRNINTILVFDTQTWKVKYKSIGHYLWQHDPDFVDGNRISVFDNNNIRAPDKGGFSRIILEYPPQKEREVVFQGTPENPFFTPVLGKHQWLKNDNLLITDNLKGRVMEINPEGKIVWQYVNIIEPGWVGSVQSAERLPLYQNKAFFQKHAQCQNRHAPPSRSSRYSTAQ